MRMRTPSEKTCGKARQKLDNIDGRNVQIDIPRRRGDSIDAISLLCLACGQQQSPEDAMRLFKIALMAVGAVALLGPLGPVAAFDAKEVGSFHIGGQALTLQGLPVKELVYTAGGPQTKMDPNGDFQTGQLYV